MIEGRMMGGKSQEIILPSIILPVSRVRLFVAAGNIKRRGRFKLT